ncbi:MAG: SPASM domain-containing protein [Sphingomonadales bacterium]
MSRFSVQDSLNLFSKFTLRRAWNAVSVLASYYISKYTGKAIQWGLPISISIEPTTSCNLRCPECPSGLRSFTRDTGMLQTDFFRQTIDQLHRDLFYLVFYFQGEPYLNPAFLEMVRYASQKKIYTATSTNAHYLTEENARRTIESGLDRLIISIDGTTQEVYEQYRVGGQLQKVLDGAARVVKWKKELRSKTPFIVFQFLVVRPNEHQIEEARQLARRIGVDDIWFKTAQIYDYANDPHQLIPTRQSYSRYRSTPQGNQFKGQLANHCWRLWHDPVITWNGLVAPCCFDKDAQYKMGDLQQQSFVEIWRSEPYRQFRAKILKGRKQIDICSNCSEGTRVWGD